MRIALLVVALLFIGSCKSNVDKPIAMPDKEAPKIMLTTPVDNQVYKNNELIIVNGTITDNTKLSEGHIEITNVATGNLLTHEHFSSTESSFSLTRSFSLPAGSSYNVKIEVSDTANNNSEKEVKVIVN